MKKTIIFSALLVGAAFSPKLSAAALFASADGSGETCSEASPCSLTQALLTAANNAADDTITLAAGSYANAEGFAYEAMSQSITLTGAGQDDTFITASAADALSFSMTGTVTVSGITFQNGSDYGLKLLSIEDEERTGFSATVFDCTFSDNNDTGLWIENTIFDGSIEVYNNTFTNNATSGDGGGLFVHNFQPDSLVTLQGNIFQGNSAADRGGGAFIESEGAPDSVITVGGSLLSEANTFVDNTANNAGAIFIQTASDTNFIGNTLSSNQATGSCGAVNLRFYNGVANFSDNIIQDNSAQFVGGFQVGAMPSDGGASAHMNGNYVAGNTSEDYGGGILILYHADATSVISNNIFIENAASTENATVGGLNVYSEADQDIDVVNNTFVGNSCPDAVISSGALMLASRDAATTVNLSNNLFRDNTSHSPGTDVYVFQPVWTGMNFSNNDFSGFCIYTADEEEICNEEADLSSLPGVTATDNLYNIDPLFVGEGELYAAYALQEASPVIAQGNGEASSLPEFDFTNLTALAATPDLGALQYCVPALSLAVTGPESDLTVGDTAAWTLTITNDTNCSALTNTLNITFTNSSFISGELASASVNKVILADDTSVSCDGTDIVSCSINNIPQHDSVDVNITSTASVAGTITLSAEISNALETASASGSGGVTVLAVPVSATENDDDDEWWNCSLHPTTNVQPHFTMEVLLALGVVLLLRSRRFFTARQFRLEEKTQRCRLRRHRRNY